MYLALDSGRTLLTSLLGLCSILFPPKDIHITLAACRSPSEPAYSLACVDLGDVGYPIVSTLTLCKNGKT